MACRDSSVRKQRDRERYARRSAERVEAGLCPRCGRRPPAPERSICEPCAAKRNAAGRNRDARLRAEGKPRRDPARANEYDRERNRRERERRTALGLCIRCGKAPAAPDRASCEPCLEKRRAADRAKYAAGKAAGLPYGGTDPDVRRKSARARSKRRQEVRLEAGLCIRCGHNPPADGGITCAPCRRRRSAKNTNNAAPPGFARDAEGRRSTVCRAVPHAPSSRRPATIRNAETRARASCIPNGRPGGCVHPAERLRRGPADVPLAPSAAITARRISGGCRCGTRAGR